MPNTKLNSQQAFEIAQGFHNLAILAGKYRFDNWNQMTPNQRKSLEDFEYTLSNYSSDFNYQSIVLLVKSSEVQSAVSQITKTTKIMERAISNLKTINDVLGVLATAFTLGGAIISGNPVAIAKAIGDALTASGGEEEEEEN